MDSHIKIYVERNLGFEAEHHARDLGNLPGVVFHQVIFNEKNTLLFPLQLPSNHFPIFYTG